MKNCLVIEMPSVQTPPAVSTANVILTFPGTDSVVLAILVLPASIAQTWTSASNKIIFVAKKPIVSTQKEVTTVVVRKASMVTESFASEGNVRMNYVQQTKSVWHLRAQVVSAKTDTLIATRIQTS